MQKEGFSAPQTYELHSKITSDFLPVTYFIKQMKYKYISSSVYNHMFYSWGLISIFSMCK